jgi:acyl transferase domain-containing protein
VSSFGIGGSNAHVILEEFVPPEMARVSDTAETPVTIVLSAKKPDRLLELARRMSAYLQELPAQERPTLRELAYTLQVGREAWAERLAFTADSFDDIVRKLNAFVAGDAERAGVRLGRAKSSRAEDRSANHAGDRIGAWLSGATLDWREIWPEPRPRRISLPTYPFARNRYWFDTVKRPEPVEAAPTVPPASPPPKVERAPANATTDKAEIEAFLARTLAKLLYLEDDAIDHGSSFIDLGLDSVLAVEWIHAIKVQYGIKLPATKVYDYPTVTSLTEFVVTSLRASGAAPPSQTASATPPTLDEILEHVQTNRLSVAEAERLIDTLDLAQEDNRA